MTIPEERRREYGQMRMWVPIPVIRIEYRRIHFDAPRWLSGTYNSDWVCVLLHRALGRWSALKVNSLGATTQGCKCGNYWAVSLREGK